MQFFSTRDQSRRVSASQAIAQGLSEEGGLFVPESFPQVDVGALCELDYPAMAAAILREYLTDYDPDFLAGAAAQTYGAAFGGKAGCLAPVEGETWALELWHGPTCAFKDYALQLMPKLLVEAKRNLGRTEKTLILVATSGDTGKAALDGYHDIPGVEIAVFYPTGGTSEIQRLQMATQEGANVAVYAVRGNFDDAQTGVKRLFSDAALRESLAGRGYFFSSANSINWGRILPQIVYYVSAYCDLLKEGKVEKGDPINVCVPTGNFGNILSAYYAKQMGVPIRKLICASNQNNVLTDFIKTGVYDRNRPFYNTMSPSMDILISSNLERMLFEFTERDDVAVKEYMSALAAEGRYEVSEKVKKQLDKTFAAGCCGDAETQAMIAKMWKEKGCLIDTHTAVAFHVLEEYRRETGDDTPAVVVSTASPFKFCDNVLGALGVTELADGTDILDQLSQVTGQPVPAPLAGLKGKEIRFQTVTEKEHMADQVLEMLR